MRLAIQDTARSALSISSPLEKMPKVVEQIQRNGKRRAIEDRPIHLAFPFSSGSRSSGGKGSVRGDDERRGNARTQLSGSCRKYPK